MPPRRVRAKPKYVVHSSGLDTTPMNAEQLAKYLVQRTEQGRAPRLLSVTVWEDTDA